MEPTITLEVLRWGLLPSWFTDPFVTVGVLMATNLWLLAMTASLMAMLVVVAAVARRVRR